MKRPIKIILIISLFCVACTYVMADRGIFKRKKSKLTLNIKTIGNLKSSVYFNLRSGLNYKGSTILSQENVGQSVFENSIVSYKKGNTVYVLPYKQKVIIPDYSPSTGYKIIIRP